MAILDDLSGPVPVPTPLGESAPITTGSFGTDFQQLATTLTGVGKQGIVNPAIGNGNTTQVTPDINLAGTDKPLSNVGGWLKPQTSGEMIIPDAPLTESEIDTDFFREGGTKKEDRQSDRQTRKAEGLRGKDKRQKRKADRRARKRSWDDSQV